MIIHDMDEIKISVVIPTYNHATFLKRALDSVISQEFSSFEIIVVDNHSSDNTKEVINSFNNPKIKYFKIHNQGVIGVSRNYGMTKASGEWIAFMDSDDLWYPARLSVCEKYFDANNNEFDVLSTNEMMVFSNSSKKKVLHHGPSSMNLYKDMIIYGNRLSPSATIIRKSFIDKFGIRFSQSKDFVTAEDYDFWLQLAYKKARFIFINSIQGEYSIHGNNASSQLDVQASAAKSVLKKHIFEIQAFEKDRKKLWRKARSRIYFSDGIKRLKNKNLIMAINLLLRSIFLSPLGLINIIWNKKFILKIK